ncbi:hypothetical protein GCM10027059_20380 [Myceligenerans halotolerans]
MRMVDQIEARLTFVRMTAGAEAESLGVDLAAAPQMMSAVRDAIAAGTLGYALLIAER